MISKSLCRKHCSGGAVRCRSCWGHTDLRCGPGQSVAAPVFAAVTNRARGTTLAAFSWPPPMVRAVRPDPCL